MKLAIVVQRYGADVSGGAELHARQIAEHLARRAEVTVLTTCARDYVTWRNEFPAGADVVHGIAVERFPVSRERNPRHFDWYSRYVFRQRHSIAAELAWLQSEGPVSPALLARLAKSGDEFDYVVLFSIRYHHAYHGARIAPDRAVLVPTAERDPALGLGIFRPVLRGVRAIMYNSPEERALVQSVAGNHDTPACIVGVGIDLEQAAEPKRFTQRFNIDRPFVLYIGRIDENKGCRELFDHFRLYASRSESPPLLVLLGAPVMEIPNHPDIRHLGHVSDEEKFDALAAASALIMPSYYESLSMVVLEAWAARRPVLVNAACDVLLGQCLRSNGGLYYRNAEEFGGALDLLLQKPDIATALGRSGRAYCERLYAWPAIETQYMEMFAQLDAEGRRGTMEPLPGRLTRYRRTEAPAEAVIATAPTGAVVERERQQQ